MSGVCPACGSEHTRPAFTVDGHAFRRCRDCATLHLSPPPAPEEVEALYAGDEYFANPHYGPSEGGRYLGYKDYLSDRAHIEEKFRAVLEHVERIAPRGRLLDVGAGPGLLVALAGERGWVARGLELNPWAAEYARSQLGADVSVGRLEQAQLPDASFEAVTMLDLIEHLADPGATLAEAARVTAPGGALALLTPDAGSVVSRAMGRRWPEAQRAPEHMVLFSVRGLSTLLRRHGWAPAGWHSVGKTSSPPTLLADVAPAAPGLARVLKPIAEQPRVADRAFELDPHTKFCVYAVRESSAEPASARTPRLPKRAKRLKAPAASILTDLQLLADARRLGDWMFEELQAGTGGAVAEIGAGIGTFSERLLQTGADPLLLVEPEAACAAELERCFGADARVTIARDELPDSAELAARSGACDLVLCQNVLEHVGDDAGAVAAMGAALKPGGRLALLVPAHPRLFGSLDVAYGHERRYTPERLRALAEGARLELSEMRHFNLLGVAGWWAKNALTRTGVDRSSLAVYDALVPLWRPIERALRPPWGLSLVAQLRRPNTGGAAPVSRFSAAEVESP